MSETNVVHLFAERATDNEVAADFAYPDGFTPVHTEKTTDGYMVTASHQPVRQEASMDMNQVLVLAEAIGDNLEGLRRAA